MYCTTPKFWYRFSGPGGANSQEHKRHYELARRAHTDTHTATHAATHSATHTHTHTQPHSHTHTHTHTKPVRARTLHVAQSVLDAAVDPQQACHGNDELGDTNTAEV